MEDTKSEAVSKEDSYDTIINDGIDWDNRTIYWGNADCDDDDDGASVSWTNVERIIRAMHCMYRQDGRESEPITIIISSQGGSVWDGLRLIDEIQIAPCPVYGVASGRMMSATTWILAVCDKRSVYENTQILIHGMQNCGTYGDNYYDDQINAKYDKELLHNLLVDLYVKNTRMPAEFWNDIMSRDTFITTEEAVILGLIDEVYAPKDRKDFRKERQENLSAEIDNSIVKSNINKIYERINLKRPKIVFNK